MQRLFLRLFSAAAVIGGAVGIALTSPAAAAPSSFHIEGGGFGHGVGMSQYGALGYAQHGTNYQDILKHYYTDTAVEAKTQPGEVRVLLAQDTSAPVTTTLTPSGHVNLVIAGQIVTSAESGQAIKVDVVDGKFNIAVAGAPRAAAVGGGSDNLYVQYNGAPITLDKTGDRYKYGQLELAATGPSALRIVLTSITMQQYLYGLGEVPSSWPADALKTQAVAARTYALEKINRLGQNRAECGCAVFGDTRDQNYVGYDKETNSNGDKWVAAVNDTNNQVVTYQGSVIQAFYSSSSGGYTENSEIVFKAALPYLKGVPDPYDDGNGQNTLHSWKRDISLENMQSWVNSKSTTSVGTLSNVEFLNPLGVSGRVIQNIADFGGGVRITGSSGTKVVGGDTFRSVINAASGANTLPSSLMHLGAFSPYGAFAGGVFVAAGRLAGGDTDRIVTGADQGGGPHVRVFTPSFDTTGVEFMAYDIRFTGGVRVAVCNFGDAGSHIVTAPGPGGGPHVRTFSANGTPDGDGFMAYAPTFTGGVYVGCGDVDPNNPGDEIITGAGAGGGPHVRIFTKNGVELGGFMAYATTFTGGVRVAGAGNMIVTGAGPGGGPHVRVLNENGSEVSGFMAYATTFTGGVYVGGGNVMGDAAPEVITGAGDSGGSHVRVFSVAGAPLSSFFAFQTGPEHGARVAGARVPGGAVVAGSGTGSPSGVRVITP
ncbi:MAG: stage sporulation protein [Actinomycetota bacterium]